MNIIDSEKVCVFIPFAGGNGLSFETLRRELGEYMPVVGVTYKGRYQKNLERAPETVDAMASEVIAVIESLSASEVIILGYSLGALVAYEVARRKHEFTPRLVSLVVAACRAPHLFSCAQVALDCGEERFVETVAKFGAIPDTLLQHPAMRSRMLPSLIKDFQAAAAYRHVFKGQLDVPLLVLGGTDDPFAPVEDVVAWKEHSHNCVRMEFLQGQHFFLVQHVRAITQMIVEPVSPAILPITQSRYPDTSARV